MHRFLDDNFGPAGGELRPVDPLSIPTNASFLSGIIDDDLREFAQKVIDIWPSLTRTYDPAIATACRHCPNSFLNMSTDPFVVAGGRFREPYYWDSYWTLLGLVRSGGNFARIARNQIEHFLGFVDRFGFVPNGARVYYLNRSQPPMLPLMVKAYVDYTGDASIIEPALPLLVREHDWWMANRTVEIYADGAVHQLNRYAVANNQPRPESFREDWSTANAGELFPDVSVPVLTDDEKAGLYADLATGAETGWDFTSRWLRTLSNDASARETHFPLRSLNTREIVPVELNSILYGNEKAIAALFRHNGTVLHSDTVADQWDQRAASRSDAMFAVFWDDAEFRYFDYNLTAQARAVLVPGDDTDGTAGAHDVVFTRHWQHVLTPSPPSRRGRGRVLFHVGQFFPFWTGAAHSQLLSNTAAIRRTFQPVRALLDANLGAIPATNVNSSEQWDEPNVWPPLMHVLIDALLLVPPAASWDAEDSGSNYPWTQQLALDLAQRWIDSVFCTWWEHGGETSRRRRRPGFGPHDPAGIMFEKYSSRSLVDAGRGGEYDVAEGFGWTNGVTIWAADVFGARLRTPVCPEDQGRSPSQMRRWLDERSVKVARDWAI